MEDNFYYVIEETSRGYIKKPYICTQHEFKDKFLTNEEFRRQWVNEKDENGSCFTYYERADNTIDVFTCYSYDEAESTVFECMKNAHSEDCPFTPDYEYFGGNNK